jgi:hypothetical protein
VEFSEKKNLSAVKEEISELNASFNFPMNRLTICRGLKKFEVTFYEAVHTKIWYSILVHHKHVTNMRGTSIQLEKKINEELTESILTYFNP